MNSDLILAAANRGFAHRRRFFNAETPAESRQHMAQLNVGVERAPYGFPRDQFRAQSRLRRNDAQATALGMVENFAMHATAEELNGELYERLNRLLAAVDLGTLADLDPSDLKGITDEIAAR